MNIYSIPIYGVIGEDTKYTDVLLHIANAQKYDAIKLLIDSPGGLINEGLKMREALSSLGKPIFTTNTGDVCSMAVDLFLLGQTKANRTFNPSRGKFLIHNPWSEMTGEGDELIQAGKELKKLETEGAKRYSVATGCDENIILQFMAENTPLTVEQIDQLGFATILQPEFKPVALYNFKDSEMENKEVIEKLSAFEKGFNAFMLKVESLFKPKCLVVQDVNGVELDFGADILEASQIQVGVAATVAGAPASGQYVMPDGSTLVFENGTLMEIIPAQGEEDMAKELEAAKAENESLKAELESMKGKVNQLAEVETNYKALNEEFKKFRSQYNDSKPVLNVPAKSSENRKRIII